jgi:pilus assembly protein CpaB
VRRSNRLIILLGVFLAVAGGLLTVVVISSGSGGGGSSSAASPTPTPEPMVTVVVAKQDINLGDTITAAMIETKQMTVSQVAALGVDTFSDVNQVIGRIAGGSITAGQVLLASRDLLTPGTMAQGQDISSAIGSGMVAVSVLVDQVNGVGTLLVPGDHVDIILSVYSDAVSLNAKDAAGNPISVSGTSQATSKMVIQNRKILATLLPPAAGPTAVPAAASSSAPAANPTQAVVTNTGQQMLLILEVAPDEAEILSWARRAETEGAQNYIDLSLALVSSKDTAAPAVTTPGITFKMLVDKYGVLPPDPRGVLPPDLAKGISW